MNETSGEIRCAGRGSESRSWRPGRWIAALLLPAGLLLVLSLRDHPGHDYLPMHAAATLLRAGEDPYDTAALERVEQPLAATDRKLFKPGEFIPYYYPPWLALACLPLTVLSFPMAKGVWVYLAYLSLVVAGDGLRALPGRPTAMAVLLGLLAVPACLGAQLGQTSALVLLLLVATWRLLEQESDWGTGLALAWLSFKPQLSVVVIPAVLLWSVRRGRWKVALGFALMLGGLCLGCALLVPGWPWGMFQAPRISPLPSAVRPFLGVTWLSVLQSLGLVRGPLVLSYAAAAVPMTIVALRAASDRTTLSSDVIALGVVAAFFVSPHALLYDLTILLFPMMALLRGRSDRAAVRLMLALALCVNLHITSIMGNSTRLAMVWLFWLPAGLALLAITRVLAAGHLRWHLEQA